LIVLDTHVLAWAVHDERKLGRKARAAIQKAWTNGRVAVSSISFWEIGLLQARGRIRLRVSVDQWRLELLAAGLTEVALGGEIALRALDLGMLHDDPADRFIVATALEHHAALMSGDERLLAWQHGLERIDARK
jgi:PIN domain nuclease of toxin-antitoxin system